MDFQFFPIDVTYETNINGKAAIQLFGRTLNGEKVCIIDPDFEPYFYVIPKTQDNIIKLVEQINQVSFIQDTIRYFVTKTEVVKKKILRREIEVIRVFVNHPSAVPELRREIKSINNVLETREADLLFVRRYLIDKEIAPTALTEVKGDIIERNDLNVDLVIRAN